MALTMLKMIVNCQHYKTCSGTGMRDRNHHDQWLSLVTLWQCDVICSDGVVTEDSQLEVAGTGCVM